ncbi:MAG: hypothetical protein JWP74_1744 [Marmoricola sp.]|nr:hypothetical protein [Marmoricola sp.]
MTKFQFDPTPGQADQTEAGANPLWCYIGTPEAGAKLVAIECVQIHDGEGNSFITAVSDPVEVTVIDA